MPVLNLHLAILLSDAREAIAAESPLLRSQDHSKGVLICIVAVIGVRLQTMLSQVPRLSAFDDLPH
jgi:hypothetical protein